MRRFILCGVMVIAMMCVSMIHKADAEEITFAFEGEITLINDPTSPLLGTFSPGQTISGSYTFESTTPDAQPENPETGNYQGALTALTFTVKDGSTVIYTGVLSAGINRIEVNDSPQPQDRYLVIGSALGDPDPVSGFNLSFFALTLFNNINGTAITDIALPLTPPVLLNFPSVKFVLEFGTPSTPEGPQVQGNVTSLTLAPIVLTVEIDIKPGSFPNSINLGSKGGTPVAILGSASLDVNDIDVDTLTLGTTGIKTVGKTDRLLCSVDDVSGDFSGGFEGAPDGFDDLVCHFLTMGIVPEDGDTTAKLAGNFLAGAGGGAFEGTDSVNVVP